VSFGAYFTETWHEGVTVASGYAVAAAWKAVGLPSVWQLVHKFALLIYFAG
jgi:hypothetical protein